MQKKLIQISKDPEKLAAALQNGKKTSSVCMHCHGAGGNSTQPEVPNLASQNADYLLEQMNKFVLGQRRSSAFMEGMIKAMTPDERIDISLFLSQQPVTRKPAGMSAQSISGKKIYMHHLPRRGRHRLPQDSTSGRATGEIRGGFAETLPQWRRRTHRPENGRVYPQPQRRGHREPGGLPVHPASLSRYFLNGFADSAGAAGRAGSPPA
ncbi:MAG: c-type cytochrome [Thiobacillus sp.]